MTGPVLAVDQGTSGTKALVVCPVRGVLGSASAPVRPRHLPGGRVEVDPRELLRSVVDAGRAALAAAGEPVVAVGLANQGETVLAWDPATGEPLTDAIVWQDRRAEELCTGWSRTRRRCGRSRACRWTPISPPPRWPGSAAISRGEAS